MPAHTVITRRRLARSVPLIALPARSRAAAEPLVAAASDLKFALEAIAARHATQGGAPVRLVFGSSGQLATQIAQGAPFEVFLSADEAFIQRLVAIGRARDEGRLYALGRIALFAASRSSLAVDPALDGLAAAVAAGAIRRFAVANPEHAPYGRAAIEALQRRGLLDRLRPALVFGENVSQAAQFAASGSAEGGIIALSLASAPNLAGAGRFAVIDASWHAPLRQRMAVIAGASAAAIAFHDFIAGREGREILVGFGFAPPPES
ncbi:MAG: molybdate ABC transporter substrate-binding protein [Alphaproteobacteria bacterium]|nr:molybdate ABC transporter substrate-binding protein [Alphaproteobacteria bacterium]